MIKIRITYSNEVEKDKLIDNIHKDFRVMNISREYLGQGKSPYKKIYMDISNR